MESTNKKLEEENKKLTQDIESLNKENLRLIRKGGLHWFLYGAGILFLGIIAGKLSRKKEYY